MIKRPAVENEALPGSPTTKHNTVLEKREDFSSISSLLYCWICFAGRQILSNERKQKIQIVCNLMEKVPLSVEQQVPSNEGRARDRDEIKATPRNTNNPMHVARLIKAVAQRR